MIVDARFTHLLETYPTESKLVIKQDGTIESGEKHHVEKRKLSAIVDIEDVEEQEDQGPFVLSDDIMIVSAKICKKMNRSHSDVIELLD